MKKNSKSTGKNNLKSNAKNSPCKKMNTRGKKLRDYEEDDNFIVNDDLSADEEENLELTRKFLKRDQKRKRVESESLSDDFLAHDDSIEKNFSKNEESDEDKLSVDIPEEFKKSDKRRTRGLKLNLVDNYVDSDSEAEEVEDPETVKKMKKSSVVNEDELLIKKLRKKGLTYEQLEKINQKIYQRELDLYNSLNINLSMLNPKDTDPKLFLESATNGSHNFYNTQNIDTSNLTQVTQALSVVNVRVFHGEFLGLSNVRFGKANGEIEVLLPNGQTDKMSFKDENAYAANAKFKLKDETVEKSMIYYRMSCFNPFRGGSYVGVKSDSVVFTEIKQGQVYSSYIPSNYTYFDESMNFLQARVTYPTIIQSSNITQITNTVKNHHVIIDESLSMEGSKLKIEENLKKNNLKEGDKNFFKYSTNNSFLFNSKERKYTTLLKKINDVVKKCNNEDQIRIYADFQDHQDNTNNYKALLKKLKSKNIKIEVLSFGNEPNDAFKKTVDESGGTVRKL